MSTAETVFLIISVEHKLTLTYEHYTVKILNTNVLTAGVCLSDHITFQRVEEGISLWTQEGRAIVTVVFGVVI